MQQETTAPRRPAPSSAALCGKPTCPRARPLKPARTTAGAKPHCAKSWRRKTRACLLPKPKEKSPGLRCSSSCAARQASTPVSTAPAFRRQGVARALLSWAFAALCLQGAQDVFLEVRAQNSAAQALYRSLGFVQTGLRRNFYATPADDAVLMQKTL